MKLIKNIFKSSVHCMPERVFTLIKKSGAGTEYYYIIFGQCSYYYETPQNGKKAV